MKFVDTKNEDAERALKPVSCIRTNLVPKKGEESLRYFYIFKWGHAWIIGSWITPFTLGVRQNGTVTISIYPAFCLSISKLHHYR